ncbi:putative ABC transporter ATP-binding protein [Actinacidiphila reveromycinica]|uniref:Putative ABC transporter ATP-binding protein n=1 Tax=Actinacidiphila reveromycinica TaxID=659352 RepID=A0A7U3VSJ5_9ACTN|nr:ABC transporter ATP-binding protein [Streptomyces sp. SN-593]BBB01946.1 putative ABC transporter ATP-binding protein [Streptomyces sp. SN-593]
MSAVSDMTTGAKYPAARAGGDRPGSQLGELRLHGISRAYGAYTALHPLDLTVTGGEFVALLGPSGCGKTTALNCLAGLLPLTAGEIVLDGRRMDTVPPEKRGFGMVFQNYALFPHLTVRANVAFGLKMRGVGKAETTRRVDDVLRVVRLSEQAHKHPGQLSGGQQQRVAIARAIVMEPPLVLMDEPLSNLDAALRLEMRSEIRRIHQEFGLTTLYVTHDQEEALSLADRLVVLEAGRVSQIGTPAELYEHPADPHVAAFMGYRNLLALDVVSVQGARTVLGRRGVRLVGTAVGGAKATPGQEATVAIRPEDVRIAEQDEPQVARAVAEIVEYHGRVLHVEAVTSDGDRVHLRTGREVRPGDALALAVDAERALVFAAGAAADGAARPVGAGTEGDSPTGAEPPSDADGAGQGGSR